MATSYGRIFYIPDNNRADPHVLENFYSGRGLNINNVPNTQNYGPDNRPFVSDDRIGSPLSDGFGPVNRRNPKLMILILAVLAFIIWKFN